MGTEKSVKLLTRKDLIAHHREMTKASGTVISVVGDVCTDEIEALANEYLCDASLANRKILHLKATQGPTPRGYAQSKRRQTAGTYRHGFPGDAFLQSG